MTVPPERLRLFVAADVPEDRRRAVGEAIAPLKRRYSEARWTAIDGQHVTLKFLGWVPAASLADIEASMEAAVAAVRPDRLRLRGLGAFPTERRARVVWAGIEDTGAVLAALANALDGAFQGFGIEAERRPFTAHLTLARFKRPRPVQLDVTLPETPPFVLDRVVLYRSHLSPRGARYEAIAVAALPSS